MRRIRRQGASQYGPMDNGLLRIAVRRTALARGVVNAAATKFANLGSRTNPRRHRPYTMPVFLRESLRTPEKDKIA